MKSNRIKSAPIDDAFKGAAMTKIRSLILVFLVLTSLGAHAMDLTCDVVQPSNFKRQKIRITGEGERRTVQILNGHNDFQLPPDRLIQSLTVSLALDLSTQYFNDMVNSQNQLRIRQRSDDQTEVELYLSVAGETYVLQTECPKPIVANSKSE